MHFAGEGLEAGGVVVHLCNYLTRGKENDITRIEEPPECVLQIVVAISKMCVSRTTKFTGNENKDTFVLCKNNARWQNTRKRSRLNNSRIFFKTLKIQFYTLHR